MEIFAEILGALVFDILFAGIGWLCLFVWYRNRKKMEKIKNAKYAGEYSAVGRVMMLNLIAGVGAISMFAMVIFSLATWIYKAITQ